MLLNKLRFKGNMRRYYTESEYGPDGWCKCPKCHSLIRHRWVTPCGSSKCPRCGTYMIKEKC